MKVALITHEGGGIASVCYGLARNLAKKKVDTTIFTETDNSSPIMEIWSDYLRIARLPTISFPPRSVWFQILNAQKLSEILKDYDIIHAVSPDATFLLTLFKKKISKPLVSTIHGSSRAGQRMFLRQPVSRWTLSDFAYHVIEFPLHELTLSRILRHSDHTTVCSFSVLEELKTYKDLNLSKVSVIHNGIDFDEIDGVKDLSAKNCDELSVMYSGRLFWYKGVMFLLKAFGDVKKDFPNVHLKIFGKGPLEKEIKRFIAQQDLQDCVSFFGYVPRGRLLAELKKSDVVVCPSLYEAQSMFVLEAMACKKPVVAFDFPFTREIMKNMDDGLTVRGGNVQELGDKIKELLSDERLRSKLGDRAYNRVRKEHNWDRQSDEYLKVYEKVMIQ